jgi:hypothetical protein
MRSRSTSRSTPTRRERCVGECRGELVEQSSIENSYPSTRLQLNRSELLQMAEGSSRNLADVPTIAARS